VAGHDWAGVPPRHPGIGVESSHGASRRLKGLLLAATANGQFNVPWGLFVTIVIVD